MKQINVEKGSVAYAKKMFLRRTIFRTCLGKHEDRMQYSNCMECFFHIDLDTLNVL